MNAWCLTREERKQNEKKKEQRGRGTCRTDKRLPIDKWLGPSGTTGRSTISYADNHRPPCFLTLYSLGYSRLIDAINLIFILTLDLFHIFSLHRPFYTRRHVKKMPPTFDQCSLDRLMNSFFFIEAVSVFNTSMILFSQQKCVLRLALFFYFSISQSGVPFCNLKNVSRISEDIFFYYLRPFADFQLAISIEFLEFHYFNNL